jgi:excisionase family DNA binding protein
VIYDMIRQRKIKAFKVGRVLRISAEEVARYETGDPVAAQ